MQAHVREIELQQKQLKRSNQLYQTNYNSKHVTIMKTKLKVSLNLM